MELRSSNVRASWINAVALVCLCGWVAYAALGKNVFGRTPWPASVVDYRIIYDFSHSIVATHAYEARHAHPPPAVVLQYATAQFPFGVSAALYLALNVVATLGCFRLLADMAGVDWKRNGAAPALLAFAACSGFVAWELRAQNSNILFLACLLWGVRRLQLGAAASAGFLLALSFSLKLFSVLVIPYLLWRRQYRAFGWTLAALAFLWVVLPTLAFGADGVGSVYRSWFEKLRENAVHRADLEHPVVVSIHNSAHRLAQLWEAPGAERLVVWTAWGVWFAVGLAGWAASAHRCDPRNDAFGTLADVALLTLGPIAVSPYLEPYHAVPAVIPAMLLASAAVDRRQSLSLRVSAGIAFGLCLIVALIPSPWPLRGLSINMLLLLLTSGAVAIALLRNRTSIDERALAAKGYR